MRLLVASDSHRAAGTLLDIVELHLEDSDVLLFLGDGENDLENVRMLYPRLHILQVAGNCDWGSDLPAWGTAKLGGKAVVPVAIPVALSLYFDIFDGFIQAYVFVFLTSLYIQEAIED